LNPNLPLGQYPSARIFTDRQHFACRFFRACAGQQAWP
jgi:hypothetical protein